MNDESEDDDDSEEERSDEDEERDELLDDDENVRGNCTGMGFFVRMSAYLAWKSCRVCPLSEELEDESLKRSILCVVIRGLGRSLFGKQ